MISFAARDHGGTDRVIRNYNIPAKTNKTCNVIELLFVTRSFGS